MGASLNGYTVVLPCPGVLPAEIGSTGRGSLTIIWNECRKRLAAIAGSFGADPRNEHAREGLSGEAPHGKSQERTEVLPRGF